MLQLLLPTMSDNRPIQQKRPASKVARVHVCDSCGYSTSRKSDLAKHQRIHTGVKPYVCKVCNRAFTQSSHLKVHRRLHTGERPYVCNTCGNTFRTYGHLSRHLKSHSTPATTAVSIPSTPERKRRRSSSTKTTKRHRQSTARVEHSTPKPTSTKQFAPLESENTFLTSTVPLENEVTSSSNCCQVTDSPACSPELPASPLLLSTDAMELSPLELNLPLIDDPLDNSGQMSIDSLFLPHATGFFESEPSQCITLDAICPSSSPPQEDSVFAFIPFEVDAFGAPETMISAV